MRAFHAQSVSVFRLILCCALLGPGAWRAAADTDDAADAPEFTRSDAYRMLRRGDELRERREWAEAAHRYYRAREKYRSLAEGAPAWEQDYFNFRISYCERELAMIVRATGRSVEEWLAERDGAEPIRAEDYRARYLTLLEENRYLRNRLQEALEELELYQEMEDIERDRARRRAEHRHDEEPAPTREWRPVGPQVIPDRPEVETDRRRVPRPDALPERTPLPEPTPVPAPTPVPEAEPVPEPRLPESPAERPVPRW